MLVHQLAPTQLSQPKQVSSAHRQQTVEANATTRVGSCDTVPLVQCQLLHTTAALRNILGPCITACCQLFGIGQHGLVQRATVPAKVPSAVNCQPILCLENVNNHITQQ